MLTGLVISETVKVDEGGRVTVPVKVTLPPTVIDPAHGLMAATVMG